MIKRLPLLCLILVCCTASLLSAHELHLKNGRIIITDNVWRAGDTVHYEQYGGTISIPYSRVKGVVYDTPQEKEKEKEEEKEEDEKEGAVEQQTEAEQDTQEQRPSIPPEKDLATKLNKALSPKNLVEQASLCTLSVKTAAGFGSGFFISDDGYIITNKHVVRGSKKQFQQVEAKIKQSRQNLRQYKRSLDTASKRQKNYRVDLEEKEALLKKLKKAGQVDRTYFAAKQQELRTAEQLLRQEKKRLAKTKKSTGQKNSSLTRKRKSFIAVNETWQDRAVSQSFWPMRRNYMPASIESAINMIWPCSKSAATRLHSSSLFTKKIWRRGKRSLLWGALRISA